MRLISRNLWINNHGMTLARCRPDSQYSKLVLASIKSPTCLLESETQSTHSWLDCITHCCNSLPTSFTEMNQLIFHKKLIVCLWINNHFNYIPMWTLHHVELLICSIVFFFIPDPFCYRFTHDLSAEAPSLSSLMFYHLWCVKCNNNHRPGHSQIILSLSCLIEAPPSARRPITRVYLYIME